jgi:ribonuclease R
MSKRKKGAPRKDGRQRSQAKKTTQTATAQHAERQILHLLRSHPDQGFTSKQIAALAGLAPQMSNQDLRGLLTYLESSGQVERLDKGKLRYAGTPEHLVGKIQVTRSGVGFLLMEDGNDIFIPSASLGKAMNGDTVKVQVLTRTRSRDRRREGVVAEVVQRARVEFVGTVERGAPGVYFLIPDDPSLRFDFFIAKEKLNGAHPGEKALARLLNWDRRSPEVEVVQVLGMAGINETEMHAILLQYGFQPEFPPRVEEEAAAIPDTISAAEIARRRDFRDVLTFTIDPIDAKDFDDALSIRRLDNGRWEIGVHIADVSHYVTPGSEIDKEAFQRATSVYLVDRTIPMLPEKLSNNLCSLRPREERLAYSAVFEMDEEANVHHAWVGRTVIFSDYRFYYEEAQEVMEGKREGPYREELLSLDRLAKKLRAARMKKGSIEFESTEVKFLLDEHDKPIGVTQKMIQDSNRLIEDFMLLANRTVAFHLFSLQQNPPLPSVYRIHDQPDPEKLSALRDFVKAFGHEVDFEAVGKTSETLNGLLGKVRGTPEQNVIESLAIRSMAKAIYSTKNIGHFGLGFPHYTHFTSPIRRYPDLMVHRLLTAYGEKDYSQNATVMEEQLRHCSDRERTAAEAERASVKYKQAEFLEDKVGQRFPGIISGIIESGFFVALEQTLCEGLVPLHSLNSDYFTFDDKNYCLTGRASGEVLRLGDPVEVEIAGVDLRRRTIDMLFVRKREPAPQAAHS